jgi:hypothetical protein
VSNARTAQNLNANSPRAIDVEVFNSVEAACSTRIAELERGNARSFASEVNKSIGASVSYTEANTDVPRASFYGKVLKVRVCHSVQSEDGTS